MTSEEKINAGVAALEARLPGRLDLRDLVKAVLVATTLCDAVSNFYGVRCERLDDHSVHTARLGPNDTVSWGSMKGSHDHIH